MIIVHLCFVLVVFICRIVELSYRTYKDDQSFIVIKSKTATSAVDIGAVSGAVLKFTMSYRRVQAFSVRVGR